MFRQQYRLLLKLRIENFANCTSRKQNQQACLTEEVSCWLAYTTKLAERISENTRGSQLTLPWSRCQASERPEVMEVAFKFISAYRMPSN